MVRRPEPEPTDQDERLGEAIESYLALAEAGPLPDAEDFAARYPDLQVDLLAALEGLALVRGLVGEPGGVGPGSRLETGRRIAGYRIVRELGRGGMGVVYEAVHVGLDRPVALKVLGSQAAPDMGGRRRFLNEARTAAGLHHTHIVPVFDVGQVGGLCYYAMQRIEGSGLDRVIRHLRRDRSTAAGSTYGPVTPLRSRLGLRFSAPGATVPVPKRGSDSLTGPWPALGDPTGRYPETDDPSAVGSLGSLIDPAPADRDDEPPPFEPPRGLAYHRWVAEVGREAAEALGHAHHRGVIHRDVKPSNLLIDGRGLIWVADFGLARRLADPSVTQHDSLLGTPRYMSPEQARVGPIDGRSDLYSLGATLYELLTLRPPFEGRSAAELVEQIANNEPVAPRQFDPRVPRDLETIVLKLLSKRSSDRYPAAADLAEDLTRFLNYEPVRARRISLPGRFWRFARRHPGVTTVSTTAAATILAITTVAYVKILHERDQYRGAVRTQLLASAKLVRHSSEPNRRMEGLRLIEESAALGPEPALRNSLRNEAVEFLVMRDVEARPPFATGRARGLVFDPDGARLATLSQSTQDGESISVWDLSSRERISEKPVRSSAPAQASGINAAPVAAANDSSGNRPAAVPGAGGPGRGGRPGPRWPRLVAAGRSLAAVSSDVRDANQSIRLFDVVTGAQVQSLPMPGRGIRGLFASPDGQRLVTVESENGPPRSGPSGSGAAFKSAQRPRDGYVVNLWNPEQVENPIKSLLRTESDETTITYPLVAISPDGKLVAIAWFHKSAVSLWSTENGDGVGWIETQAELTAVALGPDNQLATAGSGEVRLWDTVTRTPLPSLTPNQSEVRLLRFSPRGALLAIAGRLNRDVELWDTSAHALVAVLPTPDPVEDLAFSPDGGTLAAATTGDKTPVWAMIEPEIRVRIGGFDAETRALAFRHDGLLAMGMWKGTIRFWDDGHIVHAGDSSDAARASSVAVDSTRGRERPISLAFDNLGALITLESEGLRVWSKPPLCPLESVRVPLPQAPPFWRGETIFASSRGGLTLAISRGDQIFLWKPSGPPEVVPVKLPPDLASRSRGMMLRGGPRRDRNSEPKRDFRRERGSGATGGGGAGPDFNRGRPPGPPLNWRAMAVTPDGDRLYLIEFGPMEKGGALLAWAIDGTQATTLSWPELPGDATSLARSAPMHAFSPWVITRASSPSSRPPGARYAPGSRRPRTRRKAWARFCRSRSRPRARRSPWEPSTARSISGRSPTPRRRSFGCPATAARSPRSPSTPRAITWPRPPVTRPSRSGTWNEPARSSADSAWRGKNCHAGSFAGPSAGKRAGPGREFQPAASWSADSTASRAPSDAPLTTGPGSRAATAPAAAIGTVTTKPMP